jgi:hypothetical protein
MKKICLFPIVLLAALSGPVVAQGGTAPAAKSSDTTVQMRDERRVANEAFNKGKAAAQAERKAKVKAAVDDALKAPSAKGMDPLVVQRDAKSKAMKQTKPQYDAKIKQLSEERKAAFAATDKKYKTTGK